MLVLCFGLLVSNKMPLPLISLELATCAKLSLRVNALQHQDLNGECCLNNNAEHLYVKIMAQRL